MEKEDEKMISAVLSLILGTLSLAGVVPIALPVIGLALGANAVIKEGRKDDRRKAVLVMAPIAIIANGFVTLMFVLGALL
ncbi:MAG: hypothetical protein ACYSW4_03830 [Planctomycetota bacterium]